MVRTTSLACVHEKMGRIFRLATPAKFDQIHVRQNGTLTERDLGHEVVQCNHCNGSQFRSARFESVKRHFGMLCAFLMLSEQ
jgi:hypothetical protein